jgi:DNA invertase Pin-like site-specific DNA recombinase
MPATQRGPTKAILYAAKSTEDKRGSIKTQLADCRALAEGEGWQVVGEFSDEGFSAYSGNRGPGLVRARQAAVKAAPSVLVAQHSDRVARGAGDAPDAAEHLVEVVASLRRQGVTLRTCQDDLFADPRLAPVMAAMMGMRNTEDSARKSEATKAGLKRRKERGAPVGAVPLGYRVEGGNRVVDPVTRSTVERIFELVEAGSTFGDVARTLNAEGIKTRRGGAWVSRTVAKLVGNRSYTGANGYPRIIEPDRFDTVQANLARLDPAQVAKRHGGRKPVEDSFVLRGIAFCKSCGGTLYTRTARGRRTYICRNRRQGTGLCEAPTIPAELLESHVLRHLDSFTGSVEDWIAERLADRDQDRRAREAAVERARAQLDELERSRDRHLAVYERLVAEDDSKAYIAMETVERIDAERADQEHLIGQAEARLSEWSGPPDVDAALDFYSALVDHVQGRIRRAEGVRALHDALSTVVAGLWCEIEPERERLLVEFELVGVDHRDDRLPGGVPILPECRHRPTLPPRYLGDHMDPEVLRLDSDPSQTRTQTFV